MSFWSKFGKIASIAGPIAAAPFTGGTSLLGTLGLGAGAAQAIKTGLGVAGNLAKGASAQRAEDRGAQTEYNLSNDQNRLNYAQFNQGDAQRQMRQRLSADLLGNTQDPMDPRAAKFGSSSRVNPDTIAALRQQGMTPRTMTTSAQPKPTGTDSFLNTLGLAGTTLGGLQQSGLLNRQPPREQAVGADQLNTAGLPRAPLEVAPSVMKLPMQGDVVMPDLEELLRQQQQGGYA